MSWREEETGVPGPRIKPTRSPPHRPQYALQNVTLKVKVTGNLYEKCIYVYTVLLVLLRLVVEVLLRIIMTIIVSWVKPNQLFIRFDINHDFILHTIFIM